MLLIICPGRVTDSLNQAHGTPAGLQVMLLILRHLPDWIEAAANSAVTGCWHGWRMSRQTGLPGSHGLVGVHHDWIGDPTERLHLSRSACISLNCYMLPSWQPYTSLKSSARPQVLHQLRWLHSLNKQQHL